MLSKSQRTALAARLRKGRDADAVVPIGRRPPGAEVVPASAGQEQLWFMDQFAAGQGIYNVPLALRLAGRLDRDALGRAVDGLVARHEALRTRLVADASGHPLEVIDPPGHLTVELVEPASEPDQQARLREFIAARSAQPFSLAAGPLLRVSLLPLAAEEHVLLVVVHHAVFDGWSAGVLVRELAALYRAEAAGQPPGLDELPIQFADYAIWEHDRIDDTAQAGLKQYWRQALADIPVVAMPTDRPRPVLEEFDGAPATRPTAPGLLDGLKELSRREGTTMFVTVMTAMAALLSRYTGQDDIVVGTVSANRTRAELAPLIGFLVKTLPIRADLSGDPPFTELLARVKDATTGAYAHQDLPFGKIVEAAGVERDPGRSPVFQIMLTYAEHDTTPLHAAGVDFTPIDTGFHAGKFDLIFVAEARTDGLCLDCTYKTGLFDAATIDRLLGHLETLLTGAVTDPSTRLSALPLLTPAEQHRELMEWNDTAMDIGVRCVHHSFEAQAAATPDAIAAEYEDQQLTYAQLDRWAARIATRLADAGPESLVGVCMPAGLARLAALIGIWKAGAGYVPLDPALPPDRLAFMITDTAMTTILTHSPSAPAVPPMPHITVITLDDHDSGPVQRQDTGSDGWDSPATGVTGPTPANVAYVIYTSGSTGPPKGVVVEHRQVANFVHGMIDAWQIGPDDATLGFAAFTFDASVEDMFVPLLAGARIVLASPDTLHSPPRSYPRPSHHLRFPSPCRHRPPTSRRAIPSPADPDGRRGGTPRRTGAPLDTARPAARQ